MTKQFVVNIIGNMPQDQVELLTNKLSNHFKNIKFESDVTIHLLNNKNTPIAEIYAEALQSHVLIIYGLPHGIPLLGPLSPQLFGPLQKEKGGMDYIKKIYFIPTTEDEKKHYFEYIQFLKLLFTWNHKYDNNFPEASTLLDNIKVINSVDDVILLRLARLNQLESVIESINDKKDEPNENEKSGSDNIMNFQFSNTIDKSKKIRASIGSLSRAANDSEEHSVEDFLYYVNNELAKLNAPLSNEDTAKSLENIYVSSDIASRLVALLPDTDIFFLAPGGTETIDELFLFMMESKLQDKCIVLLNVHQHLDHLEKYLQYLQDKHLLNFNRTRINIVHNKKELDELLHLGFVIPKTGLSFSLGLQVPLSESSYQMTFFRCAPKPNPNQGMAEVGPPNQIRLGNVSA